MPAHGTHTPKTGRLARGVEPGAPSVPRLATVVSHVRRLIRRADKRLVYAGSVYAVVLLACVAINMLAPEFASRRVRQHGIPIVSRSGLTSRVPLSSVLASDRGNSFSADTPIAKVPSAGQCVARGLMLGQTNHPAIAQTVEEFDCGCRAPDVYEPHENPVVCAIVQSFNHVQNIAAISKALTENPAIDEVIICEDGSNDGSLDAWTQHLTGLRHFIVVSNNLHETRCYNRAMRLSSAEFFILMQDDDLPTFNTTAAAEAAADSESGDLGSGAGEGAEAAAAEAGINIHNWVDEALQLFRADPQLGVLTGFIGQMWGDGGKGYEFGEQQSDHGGMRKGATQRIPFLSPASRRPFMYVECAWIAPLFIRSAVLRRVGGLDIDVIRTGEPGMWQDCIVSYAAWTAGWRVGVYDSAFDRGVGGHGSTSSKEKARMRGVIWKRAKETVDARFERGFIRDVALQLNNETLTHRYVH